MRTGKLSVIVEFYMKMIVCDRIITKETSELLHTIPILMYDIISKNKAGPDLTRLI